MKLPTLLEKLISDISVIPDIEINHITNDSREISKNTLFLAFPGEKTDGRNYISEAIQKGAVAIGYEADNEQVAIRAASVSERLLVHHQSRERQRATVSMIPIVNLKQKQSLIAARFYDFPGKKLKIIGVTGTNGKTSVTHYLAQAFSFQRDMHERSRERERATVACGVIGTLGYGLLPHLKKTLNTTPDALRLQKELSELVNQGATTVAMEVSSHGLAENRIEHIVFDTAVFTNLTQDHLDFHGTMEQYRAAKELLFQQSDLKHAVINIDDDTGKYFSEKYKDKLSMVTFSSHDNKNADIHVEKCHAMQNGFNLSVKTPRGRGTFYLPLLGRFNIQNALAVLGVLGIFKMPFDAILKCLSALQNAPGRMQQYHARNQPSVIVDFAHTPDALQNVLETARSHCEGKLWCVFGCGGDRDRGKRPKMGAIAERLCDHVVITNDNPRSESPKKIAEEILSGVSQRAKFNIELDRAQAIQSTIQSTHANDLIIIAGKGHETEQIIGNQILHHNDGECVMRIFSFKTVS